MKSPSLFKEPPIHSIMHSISTNEKNIFFRCVEDANDAVMLTDVTGKLIYVNKAWCNIYGYFPEEVLGKTPNVLRSGRQSDDFYRSMWMEIGDPKRGYWRGELVNKAKDGHEVPVLLSITPHRSPDGEITAYMGIALNMAETKRLESEVIRQDRLASVGLLASGLAHEIGTPLGVIRGRAEYLAMQSKELPQIESGLNIIIGQIDRISKLIYSLLHLSRTGETHEEEATNFSSPLRSVLSLLSQELSQSNIEVTTNLKDEIVVRADPIKLEQVILNLIVNSIHAIREKSCHDSNSSRSITITAREQKEAWHIQFSDTGCGISKENIKKVFSPFFTTKDVGEGTGLGLAICARIIESWGGSIWAESDGVNGTSFNVLLQRRYQAHQQKSHTVVPSDKASAD